MNGERQALDLFEANRRRLTGLAYRMLGSVSEAEDIVQDAYIRWQGTDRAQVAAPAGYLSRIVARLCLDRLKSARQRREIYVGPWLPEPLVTEEAAPDIEAVTVRANEASMALMLALERLSPLERVAFILHDIFDMEFDEVGEALGRSEATCRQLASRARGHVRANRPRAAVAPEQGRRLAEAFFAASRSGDVAALQSLLVADAVLHSDGGGKKPAALRLIEGADKISRFFAGLSRKPKSMQPIWSRQVQVNGLPGWATVESDGTVQVTALQIAEDGIRAIYVIRNPDKLRHILPMLPPEWRDLLSSTAVKT